MRKRPALTRVPLSLYLAELVVIHCPAHELRPQLMALPPEIQAACDDDEDDPGSGWGHVARPCGSSMQSDKTCRAAWTSPSAICWSG